MSTDVKITFGADISAIRTATHEINESVKRIADRSTDAAARLMTLFNGVLPAIKTAAEAMTGPLHTHSKTKIYVSKYERPGKDFGKVKEISVMNPKTGEKIMDIHTKDEGIGPHAHHWKNLKKIEHTGIALTRGQHKFLEKIQQKAKDSEK